MLRLNELYLSSPADFNDPFDCRIPENFYLLDTQKKIWEYIDGAMERQKGRMVKDGINLDRMRKMMFRDLTSNIEDVQADHEKQTFDAMDLNYGVLSLSGRWDSILMWSHYAQNHRGYCIGFYEEMLRNCRLFGRGGMVIMPPNDDYPEIDPLDEDVMRKAVLQTQFKSRDWEYENEYRLTNLLFPGVPTVNDRRKHVPDEFIAEMIIGLKTPTDHVKEILAIARDKGFAVYQAVKVPFKFIINREQIA